MSRRLHLRRGIEALLAHAGVTTLIAATVTVLMAGFLGLSGLERLGGVFLVNLSISAGIAGAFVLARRLFFAPLGIERGPWPRTLAGLGLLTLAASALGAQLGMLPLAFASPELAALFPRSAVFAVAVPVTSVVVTLATTRAVFSAKAARAEHAATEARAALLGAQLEALRARTQPHFLFNALNTVAALIPEDPARAERAVEQLAALLRYSLEGSRREEVRLEEELAAVEGYLALERLRFGERLRVELVIAPGLGARRVPPMTLQPLVENAVLHGIGGRREGGVVRVEVSCDGAGALRMIVEDDGPGPSGSVHRGTGTALTDLADRLRISAGDEARLITGTSALGGFLAEVLLPEVNA